MLKISERETQVFTDIQNKKFHQELVQHIREEFPDETRDLSHKNIDEIAIHAVKSSKQYGFTEKADICQYANLMMIHGPYFDIKQDWAYQILNTQSTQSGTAKMLELYEEAFNHF